MKTILVTGGAGFVGSNLAIRLKRDLDDVRVVGLDNLRRRGSELSIPRLREGGVEFVHGDIRNREDLDVSSRVDLILECSAEPSVLAGYGSSPEYVVQTNLAGTLTCLELARRRGAGLIFLSTSRVYPFSRINALRHTETDTRFVLDEEQDTPGVSSEGIAEGFSLEGSRSLYGATKLASEIILREYVDMYGLRAVVNRCGVIAGPWQMGKVDQGVVVLWVARHIFGGPLRYIGFGGEGKQVRDILSIEDLYRLVRLQIDDLGGLSGEVFNVGGGRENAVSLRELTELCQEETGRRIEIGREPETRPADISVFVTDTKKVRGRTGWSPVDRPEKIVAEITAWIRNHGEILRPILC
ncbi:MAG: NAD-dependent epimerase/dehydratase family protein [Nitrospirae bacterium]|nr:NAD-dependent epimerase/dehydratase family protein [Nitrospirota bacterium]